MPTPRTTRRSDLYQVGFALAVALFGTTMMSPLYPLYEQRLSLTNLTVTLVFATYAAVALICLLLFGDRSDQVGRRPVLMAGLGAALAAGLLLLTATAQPELFAARVFSGISGGLFTGTATAYLLDLAPASAPSRGTLAATFANVAGLGLGALGSGIVSQYISFPLRTIYLVNVVLVVAAMIALHRTPETVTPAEHTRAPRRLPRLPPGLRVTFLETGLAGFTGYLVFGVFSASVPSVLTQIVGQNNRAVIGAVIAVVFLTSTIGSSAQTMLGERRALMAGCALLAAGLALLAAAVAASSLSLIIAAGLIAGTGQGLSFRGGLTMLTSAAPPRDRGQLTSAYFAVLFLGLAIPVVGIGLTAGHAGLRDTVIAAALLAAGLAIIAQVALAITARNRQTPGRPGRRHRALLGHHPQHTRTGGCAR